MPNSPGLRCRVNRYGEMQYAAYYTDRATHKQVQRTLKATTLTAAKKEQRRLLIDNDEGRAVAPTRITVDAVADELVASMRARVASGDLRPRTVETIEYRLRVVREKVGRRPVQSITADTIAALNCDLGVRGFYALRRLLGFAVRRGYIAENPFLRLERGERPKATSREVRVLEPEELRSLIEAVPEGTQRALVSTVALSGLRQSEALGLRWQDVDFKAGVLHVRSQLGRDGHLVPPKTDLSRREVVLSEPLAAILGAHRTRMLAVGRASAESFVFSTRTGTAITQRNATRAVAKAAKSAGLKGVGFHMLRHGFASTLIVGLGLDPVRVQRQLGHARPSITLDVYAHLFERAAHADDLRERIGSSALAGAVVRS